MLKNNVLNSTGQQNVDSNTNTNNQVSSNFILKFPFFGTKKEENNTESKVTNNSNFRTEMKGLGIMMQGLGEKMIKLSDND